jgi:hypothetical protein
MSIEPFVYSATQRTNGSCILDRGCWRQYNVLSVRVCPFKVPSNFLVFFSLDDCRYVLAHGHAYNMAICIFSLLSGPTLESKIVYFPCCS